jgi:hypothetical protein
MVSSLNQSTPARDSGYVGFVQALGGRITAAAGGPATLSQKIGTLPAGTTILGVYTNVETALVGTTPTFNIGTTAAGTDIAAGIALTAGSVNSMPLAALVMPLAADTDVWANITGTPTAGDAYVIVTFVKPAG